MTDQENQSESNIRPYEVDGIQECDNPLPAWWVGLFLFTIVFTVVYLIYFHVLGGPNQIEQYNLAMEAQQSRVESESVALDDNLEERIQSTDYIQAGLPVYTTNCAPCHQADGSGSIGPNLTDNFWIHGGTAQDIVKLIENGVAAKGMPAWRDILGRKKIEQLTALIVSWRGKNLPGKGAEGQAVEYP